MVIVVAASKLVIRTRLVCREAAMVLLSAQFFTWPSVPVYVAPVSVCCVAVRAVMRFFHVCLFPVVSSVVSVVVPRHVLHHPRILPAVVIHRGVPRIAVPARSSVVRTRRCCLDGSAGDGQSYRRRSSVSSAPWRCSRFG